MLTVALLPRSGSIVSMWKCLCAVVLLASTWPSLYAESAVDPLPNAPATSGPETAFRAALVHVQAQLAGSDLTTIQPSVARAATAWLACEDDLRSRDRQAYATTEEALGDLQYSVAADSLDLPAARDAITRLTLAFPAVPVAVPVAVAVKKPQTPDDRPKPANPADTSIATLSDVHARILTARTALRDGQRTSAMRSLAAARRSWPDVEGAVKTRNATAYTRSEELFAHATAQVKMSHPEAEASLTELAATLAPFTTASTYGVMDAFLILLREGVEALFVISALLAYLGRSGHAAQQRIIWWGASAGVLVSLALAIVIHLVFRATFSGANREAIEGFVGLAAAGLLFWVSWWLHRATSLSRWNAFIKDRTSSALATGSVWSLAMLSFLAVLREGAETALFYLGMAPSIATADLLVGIALGAATLVVVGVAIIQLGARLPIRPLFAVLGVLLLAMGIKFVGSGVHALQIADLASVSVIAGWPTVALLGFFPTWETVLAQGLVVVAVVAVLLLSRLGRFPRMQNAKL